MTFDIEIVLRDRDTAIAQRLEHDGNDASDWTELDVHHVLKSMLLAIDREHFLEAVTRHSFSMRAAQARADPFLLRSD